MHMLSLPPQVISLHELSSGTPLNANTYRIHTHTRHTRSRAIYAQAGLRALVQIYIRLLSIVPAYTQEARKNNP